MVIGVGINLFRAGVLGGDAGVGLGVGFFPGNLFLTGAQGAWYDPSDFTTLYSSSTGGEPFRTEARRNLLTYSEQFDDVTWNKQRTTVTANAVTAPDGTTTADAVFETVDNGAHGVYQSITKAAFATTYAVSCYVKPNGRDWAILQLSGPGETNRVRVWFDLSGSGAVGSNVVVGTGFSFVSASIQALADGWYRCTTVITGDTSTTYTAFVRTTTGDTAVTYVGDITKGLYLWGAQLELGSTATTYQRVGASYDYIESPVGLMLDRSRGLVLGPELRGTGVPALSGSATAATYNAGTGAGTANRVNPSNQSFVNFGGFAPGSAFVATVQNTGSVLLVVRQSTATSAGAFIQTISAGQTATVVGQVSSTGFMAVSGVNDGTSVDFTVLSLQALPGNHASQATSASRPVLRARYNLLRYSEEFDNAAWSKGAQLIATHGVSAPDGSMTASRFQKNGAANIAVTQGSVVTGAPQKSIWARSPTGQGTKTIALLGYYDFAKYQFTITEEWQRFDAPGDDAETGGTSFYALDFRFGTATQVEVWGAQLQTAADQTSTGGAYQRIAAATDYDVSNPVWRPYLAFDGVDDSFGTSSIDFSATDEMTVFAGVSKLSDAALGMVVELTANSGANNGAFYITAPHFAGSATYEWRSRGTNPVQATTSGVFAAPITNVLTGIGDISADVATLRVNGAQAATSASDQGTGNFGNYPLFIGRRNNTNLPFNGRLYSLAVLGRTATDAELASMEAWVAGKTGAF
jgi:hypothetical protein